jgi:hypothetical protein
MVSNAKEFFIIQLDCNVPNYKNILLQEQRKANMNKLNIKVFKKSSREFEIFIPYTYIQKKFLRSRNTMSYGTWTSTSPKPLLATPL